MWHQGPAALRAESREASQVVRAMILVTCSLSRMVCDLKAYGGKQRAAALGGPLMVGVAGGHLDRYLRPVEATPRTAKYY